MQFPISFVALIAVWLAYALPNAAFAQAAFKIDGEVKVVGPGCPKGTASVLPLNDPNTQALTVLFSALSATGQAPKMMGNGRDRADPVEIRCTIMVDLIPNPGVQIALINVDVRGSVDVFGPRDTDEGLNNVVQIDRGYTFATKRTDDAKRSKEFLSQSTRIVDSQGGYTIGEEAMSLVTFAGCNAIVRAKIVARVGVTGEFNYGDISAIDQNSSVQFAFRTRACTGNEPTKDPVIRAALPSRRAANRNMCVLEGDAPTAKVSGQRMKVCYDEVGRVISREPDPSL